MAWEEEDLDERGDLTFFIARDIECQWDLYLANTNIFKKLAMLKFNVVIYYDKIISIYMEILFVVF